MYSIPNIPDLLSRAIYADLCTLLPPPPDDTPEARHLRDERAMTAVAHLLPENAAEAEVAVLVVAAQSRAREALRAASQPGLDPDQTRRCTAQAACMMRQADGSIRTLLRMQAERQKAETAMRPAAMERAGYWFRSTSPEPDPPLDQEPATQHPLPLREEPAPDVIRGGGGRGPAESPGPTRGEPPKLEYGAMTPAERLVTLYPDRAAAILAAGGLPARLTFPPPDSEVVTELLTGSRPLLRAFREAHAPEPMAA
jgi:hypothetical protein